MEKYFYGRSNTENIQFILAKISKDISLLIYIYIPIKFVR